MREGESLEANEFRMGCEIMAKTSPSSHVPFICVTFNFQFSQLSEEKLRN